MLSLFETNRISEGVPSSKVTIHGNSESRHAPRPKPKHSLIRVLAYSPQEYTEGLVDNPHLVAQFPHAWPVTWVSVQGLGDLTTISYLGELFGLHQLALEDVLSGQQRVKVDDYEEHLFVVAKMLKMSRHITYEQLNLFIGENFVLTFQEDPTDGFDAVRDRIRRGQGAIRKSGADYLAYALLDSIIDNYFPILEHYGEMLERLEEESFDANSSVTVAHIHKLRHELLSMRRIVWPMREVLHFLDRDNSGLIKEETKIYLRDCYDHANQITELIENYRDLASGIVDVYLSSSNNRMNEVMKILTMISTIFIPLSFIASIYGMNFNSDASPLNMPELNWFYGYPFCLGLMGVISLCMLTIFWRKGWIGHRTPTRHHERHRSSPA